MVFDVRDEYLWRWANIRCIVYAAWAMVYEMSTCKETAYCVRCRVNEMNTCGEGASVWCITYGVWCLMYEMIICEEGAYGVWCVVYSVWYMT
jgi:hypothetical protein